MADSFDPTPRQPANIDPPTWVGDERVLELVEGALPPAEEARRMASLPPEMQRLITLLKHDRAVLCAVGDEAAPAGLADAVLARLERDALFEDPSMQEAGLLRRELDLPPPSRTRTGEGERVAAPAPIPFPRGRSTWQVQRLAVAAGIALVLGGSMVLMYQGQPPARLARSGGPQTDLPGQKLALETGSEAPQAAAPGSDMLAMSERSAPRGRVEVVEPPPVAVAAAPEVVSAEVSPARAVLAASSTGDAPADAGAMSLERALELAGEGRLGVRVAAVEPREAVVTLQRLAARSLRSDSRRTWRLDTADPATVAMATTGVPTRAQIESGRAAVRAASRMLAGGKPDAVEPMIDGSASLPPAFDPRLDGGVYEARVNVTPQALAVLRTALSGPGLRAEFFELPGASAAPAGSVHEVMWWTQPTSQWQGKAVVPVVVTESTR